MNKGEKTIYVTTTIAFAISVTVAVVAIIWAIVQIILNDIELLSEPIALVEISAVFATIFGTTLNNIEEKRKLENIKRHARKNTNPNNTALEKP